LTDGTLSRDRFRFYAVQDALYLREFARALALTAARAPEDDWIVMLSDHAANALRVERSLHESFFVEFGVGPDAVRATPLAPTNVAYTRYLLATAYAAPFHEASPHCSRATGSTGRSAGRSSGRHHRTRSTCAGSRVRRGRVAAVCARSSTRPTRWPLA
jgi:hypothetical protein